MKYIILLFISFVIFSGCTTKSIETGGNKNNPQLQQNIKKENPEIITSDNLKISTDYYFEESKKDSVQPLVILIHQFNSDRTQWSSELIDTLISSGFKVIAFDLRSHGKSDKAKIEFQKLLTDPEQTPKDVEAVIKWAKSNPGVDSNNIGCAGTSIGGSLSLYASYYLGAKTSIGISIGKMTFENLTGNFEAMMGRMVKSINNVMLICGKQDGNCGTESQMIYDTFLGTPKEYKQFESKKHGKELIKDFPGINNLIVEWFVKYLK